MVRVSLFEKSLDAKDGMIKVVELWPCDVDVQSGNMVLDSPANAFGESINVLEAVHLAEASRLYFARLMRPVESTPDAKTLRSLSSPRVGR
jgi:hypothetical protein